MDNLISNAIAFGLTIGVIILLKPLALRLGLADVPGGRKSHEGNIPLIGGIAIFIGVSFAFLTLNISLSPYRCLIACIALLVVTGILDDFHELSPKTRLFVQIFTGFLMVWWGKNSLLSLGNLFNLGDIKLGYYFAFPVTIFAVVAIINAVNMTDGVDGLAGSISFIELFYLGWLCHHAHFWPDKMIIELILCGLLGFLYFNFPIKSKASVFLGDSGSMMLGFMLVWFCVFLSQPEHLAAPPVVFLWIMAVPIFEISSVVFRRLIRGFSPFKADRGHLHYFLLEKNLSSLQATLVISLMSVIMGLIGILGEKYLINQSILFTGFFVVFIVYFWITLKYFQ
jgi:UDP-GlcNAc:undecaprenyl-phosphate GlcNAc-1-phosphate transferase